MQGELKIIEDQLNKLCSQHDELMALLDIYDYIPNLRSLQQTNRTIYSRITHFEQEIEDLLQTSSTVKIREEIHLRTKQEEFKVSMQTTEMQIHELNRKIEQQRESIREIEEGRAMTRRIVGEKEAIRRKGDQLLREFEEQSARLVAGQTVAMREVGIGQRSGGKKIRQGIKIEELLRQVVPDQMYSYQKLQHEIELQQLQLPIPPFSQFLQFTHGNLKSEILDANQAALNLQVELSMENREGSSSEHPSPQVGSGQAHLLNRKYVELQYRVRALKRYCGEELMLLYAKTEDKMEVCGLEEQAKQKLKELDHLLCVLRNNLSDEAGSYE